MKKLIILFISLMVGLLLISGCVPKEEEIKQKQERKIVINNLFTNMIENKDSAFLDVEKYSGMDENKKYLLGNEIACYSYQYMKYSIEKEEKIDIIAMIKADENKEPAERRLKWVKKEKKVKRKRKYIKFAKSIGF